MLRIRTPPTKLKLAIVAAGVKQIDLADATEMSESRLSRLARGRVMLREHELRKIAKALGVAHKVLQ